MKERKKKEGGREEGDKKKGIRMLAQAQAAQLS